MKLTSEDILLLKQIEKPLVLLDRKTRGKLEKFRYSDDLEFCGSSGWTKLYNANINEEATAYRLRQDYELPPEEENKVYQWVLLREDLIYPIYMKQSQIAKFCRQHNVEKYANLSNVLQPDGSISIDKMKEVSND